MERCILGLVIVAAVIGCCTGCGGGKGVRIPAESFFSASEKTNFRISPNGEHIAYLGLYQGQKNIYVIHPGEGNKSRRITNEQALGVQSYFWADNDELIFTKEKKEDSLQVFAVNRTTLAVRDLMPPSSVKIRWISPAKVIDGGFLISINERDSVGFDVYRLRTDACKKELVAKNPGNIIRWFADVDGQLRLALASDSVRETVLYRKSENEPFRAVISNSFRNSIAPLGFSRVHPSHVFALSNVDRDKQALVEIDMETGTEVREIFSHPDVDVDHGGYLNDRGEMSFAAYDTWRQQRHFLDRQTELVYKRLEKKLEGYEINILDRDTSRNGFIVRSFTDTDPGAIYHYDLSKDGLVKLAENSPALKDSRFAEMKPITYSARDGRRIQGYLTMPIRSRSKRVPVIVYPHGGPGDRNRWGFNPEVQFFANRGFAVFQVNYRGSTGYGKEFWSAGFKEWGGKVQDDITDGVRWLIDEGIVDSTRIGIYGAGFGGYAALHGACFNSDLYACAASYSGFTNLFAFLKEIPPHLKPYVRLYYEIVGNPETEHELLRATSPVFHADRVNIPVFIAQGGKDKWNAPNETSQFVHKLRKRKIPVTYFLREDEGWYFRNDENRIAFYRELGEFFDKHLK